MSTRHFVRMALVLCLYIVCCTLVLKCHCAVVLLFCCCCWWWTLLNGFRLSSLHVPFVSIYPPFSISFENMIEQLIGRCQREWLHWRMSIDSRSMYIFSILFREKCRNRIQFNSEFYWFIDEHLIVKYDRFSDGNEQLLYFLPCNRGDWPKCSDWTIESQNIFTSSR